jgi:hypothetical protein
MVQSVCAYYTKRTFLGPFGIAALNILRRGGGAAFGEALPLGGPENREPDRL